MNTQVKPASQPLIGSPVLQRDRQHDHEHHDEHVRDTGARGQRGDIVAPGFLGQLVGEPGVVHGAHEQHQAAGRQNAAEDELSGIFSTKRSRPVRTSRLSRMLVPNPNKAFQSPVPRWRACSRSCLAPSRLRCRRYVRLVVRRAAGIDITTGASTIASNPPTFRFVHRSGCLQICIGHECCTIPALKRRTVVRTVTGFSVIRACSNAAMRTVRTLIMIVGIASGEGNRHRRGTSAFATGLRLAGAVVVSHRCCRVVPRRA